MNADKAKFTDQKPILWLLSPLSVLLVVGGLAWVFKQNDAPAWFQVIGSLGAVVTALVVANKQARDTAQARRAKDEVVYRLVCGVADRAAAVSSLLFRNFDMIQSDDKAARVEIMTTVEEQLLAMRGINPVDLPLPEMVEPFLIIRGALEQSVVMARLLSDTGVIDRLRCATTLSMNSQAIHQAARKLSGMQLS
ncbi:hypothetical protein [Pseudomonas hormoni]